jgi:hypothetical protein
MEAILKPIALNERSYNVNLLHKALAALGLPVAKREIAQGKAGQDTLKKVRALQVQLNVPVDKSTLVDEATALAIAEALKKRGLTVASRSFTVTGTVRLPNGLVKKRQKLLAFDLDLRGVAVYRDIKNIAEIRKSGGFEFLGQTVSDNLGNYRITFYDWQYGQAERKKADVVVYAIEGAEIIGRSRMVNSEDYSDKGLVRDLDVFIEQEDKRTEYEVLMSKLNAFLEESKTSLAEIAKSRDQLVFTAGELDVDLSRITIAASAELLAKAEQQQLSHELLYGIGRQGISLSWTAFYKKKEEELRRAIAKSEDERIIRKFQKRQISAFLQEIQECAVKHTLDDKEKKDKNTLNAMLKNALPEEKQRLSFLNALRNFKGSDFREFWNKHLPDQPEFKDKPGLISGLLLAQQLTLLSGNHQALVKELQVNRKLTSMHQLIDLEKSDWIKIIKKTGAPDFIEGKNDEEKMDRYADVMQSLLNASFPTQRIAKMIEKGELPIEKTRVSKGISTFLSTNEQFDFATSRIHNFDEKIKDVAGDDFAEVRSELMKIQRVFQVSTSPEAMKVLVENNLHSAYTIANIPRKSFIKTYGNDLGGERAAFAIHQRASYISTRAEMNAMHLWEYSHGFIPPCVMGVPEFSNVKTTLQNKLPNYMELFGSPDICECEHCRSVYSPAAYFVELLRFLQKGVRNSDGKTPLEVLAERRPDLLHLKLTCENTNTIIPYIDLANEVMEYYTAKGSLATFEGYDTGEATAEELRANPQNFNIEAYRILSNNKEGKKAVYPFTLPYHQPLDVIRTYSDHLKVSRYEVMKAMNPLPGPATTRAIEAESLGISQEEYTILTGEAFDGTADTIQLYEYFGYKTPGQLENMSQVREFLKRSGIAYIDLVELIKTQFINPYQGTLDFLQKIFSYALIDAKTIYKRLGQIETGTLDPTGRAVITRILDAYNSAIGTSLTFDEFAQWGKDHLAEFRQIITLYEPESKCSLETTELKTIKSIYEGSSTSGISEVNDTWSKIHRFIRLWRKLGWTIHETDLMLAALGEDDIATETISKLESVALLLSKTKLPLNQLAVLWGNIDTYGDKSLYKKQFLNKAVQQIDEAFKADAWGNYLQREVDENGDPITLAKRRSAILAAFRMTEEDLDAILKLAKVIDGGNLRNLKMDPEDSDKLNIQNLSTIYRYVVLAKALKMKVPDLCKIIDLFSASPFSTWDIQQKKFVNISPADTYQFYKLAASTKEAGFKSSVLEYVLQGTLPADSTMGLDKDKTLQTAKTIRDALAAIEHDHPKTPELPLTVETLTAKLSLTFKPEIVSRFLGIVEGSASFETITDDNLDITIPDEISDKYTYIKGSGRLTCDGIMSDIEKSTLKGLANSSANFQVAVDQLYVAPETFISDNFNGIFSDLAKANATLLDHPAQTPPASLDEKLAYVYEKFLPLLKSKLRKDAITKHIAALIGLSEEATALLVAGDIEKLVEDLSTEGFSARYFNATDWNDSDLALERTDSTIDFSWGDEAPDPSVSADKFSVRWKAYIAAPASGKYTLVVDVEEADDVFSLYLDDILILQKAAGDAKTSWEKDTDLNAAQMHLLTLEYAETSQNAGIRLRWKTVVTAPEIIPASAAYPEAILDDFVKKATLYHRASKFISGFKISETELDYFIRFKSDFKDIDFMALTAEHWKRINDYITLRNNVPQAQSLLTEVFALANRPDPLPAVNELTEMLHKATAWDETSLKFLVDTHFTLGIDDFKNEIALNRLYEVMKIVSKTGILAETIAKWGAAETDFDDLHKTGQLIKYTVKAKYEEEDWLSLAGNLSDKIREHQKQALISYLLMQRDIQEAGVEDADGLFEYFLIDVQMGACMDTSRIVQANSSIQMFVNRCLINLEKDVSPDAIDKDRWEWMKNYRVWEANRKVFLYPENWLEPEWRKNRSEFFKELESYLVQNDITERSVEQGFRNYLTSLNEVANLEVCGMYQENYEDGKLKYLHVFARTHNAPYKFFYRRWNKHRKWSAWEKIQVDIRSVENGDNSGVHLIPVVWKKRLFLFWPEFIEKQEAPPGNSTQSVVQVSDDQMSLLEPKKYWEIRLAWSEYVDGKWSPKQVSKEFTPLFARSSRERIRFIAYIDRQNRLRIRRHHFSEDERSEWWLECSSFDLSDITSKILSNSVRNPIYQRLGNGWSGYNLYYMNFSKSSALELLDDVYLASPVDHKILLSPERKNYLPTLEDPFFFSDACRTYFVRPMDILIIYGIRNPEYCKPPIAAPVGLAIIETGNPNMPVSNSIMIRSGNVPAGVTSDLESVSKIYGIEIAYINEAFGSAKDVGYVDWRLFIRFIGFDKGLEFHTFYHPFSSEYVKNLNQGGLSRGNKPKEEYPPGLMESDTEILSDEGDKFRREYNPSIEDGLVRPHNESDDFKNPQRTYYKENICFDVYGANSLYNWELFFHAPLYIATRLSKNGKYEEAMKWFHYIFDPTTDEEPEARNETSRYWKVLPFKTERIKSLEDWFRDLNRETNPSNPDYNPDSEFSRVVSEWRDNPFDPHLVASNRPLAYMKHVVIKYVENLIARGDSLFRQDTMESVNEALQIYVIANHILGPRPEFFLKRGEIKPESYLSLKDKWDTFSNALVELENIFPYSSEVKVVSTSTGTNLLGIGSALYFCIPANEKLLEYWDTVKDRLFKIRHCQNIEGVERKLALFAPPISPEALIQAVSQGLSLGSILADLSSPPPIYRFTYLIQKANEFCAEVKTLGSALLAALEKKDAEELSRLRASHETQMLELVTAIKERQVLDARAYKESLMKSRETAKFRLQHYIELLGNESVIVPPEPTIAATLTADSQLPVDTSIVKVETDVDELLVRSDERGVKLIPKEKEDIEKSKDSMLSQQTATGMEGLAGTLHLIPTFTANFKPFGVGADFAYGGSHLGSAISGLAKIPQIFAAVYAFQAAQAAKTASYIRREQDWTLQANLAAKEIIQLDKQITSADIRIQVAEKELENHKKQIENAKEVELFLKDKFTNQELYQWMKEQLFAVYKQSYNLAYDMAKKAEKAYKYEMGMDTASFIQYGYWDNSKQGLVAGEKLQLALRQLEKSYLEENRREPELTKSISLAMLNPLALIELRETGKCYVSLPEELFDLDFQGHYFRRIKSLSLSIPCIAGPFTTVNCSLRLLKNTMRINTVLKDGDQYEHKNDEGLWIDDDRFRTGNVPVTSIATSTGQNDAGMFEFNFRDERYLPFEGAGVISDWMIELSTEKDFRQFDYSTISDVILHLKFTARESGGLFKEKVATYIKDFLMNIAELADQPLMRMFSMRHEFPTEWHKFLHPSVAESDQILNITIGRERMPFFTQHRKIDVMRIDVLARTTESKEEYTLLLSVTGEDDSVMESSPIAMPQNAKYGDLQMASFTDIPPEAISIEKPMSLKLKHSTSTDFKSLDPDEMNDILLVLHYKLSNEP